MCGVIGVVAQTEVNQLLYDGLLLLQHRGQDAAGIATADRVNFFAHKAGGMVRDVFRTRDMLELKGTIGIGHVRYQTAGSHKSIDEAQPLYVNAPFGLLMAHNGNLTNSDELKEQLFQINRRHIHTHSDSEVLLNILAHEIQSALLKKKSIFDSENDYQFIVNHRNDEKYSLLNDKTSDSIDTFFQAVEKLHQRVRGSYSTITLIVGWGILAFRDPNGIRPLCIGKRVHQNGKTEWMLASESVALENLGFIFERDVLPGEAIFIDFEGVLHSRTCASKTCLAPCIFEYVYLARPDSCIEGILVYKARLQMGNRLAKTIKSRFESLRQGAPHLSSDNYDIDVVMPIPDSSRPAAMQVALHLGVEYREGFFKNRYIGRTFIMPGNALRKASVKRKLNALSVEFRGKNVLLVDDSIVRGTTSRQIIQMAREAGARKVFFASAAPPVSFPNVYGIAMPTRTELVAGHMSEEEIAKEIGADVLIYQTLDDLKKAVLDARQDFIKNEQQPVDKKTHELIFDCSCFDGNYITGDVDEAYLQALEKKENSLSKME